TMDSDTVDIAEAHKVYIRCVEIRWSCFFKVINTSDCPTINDSTALYYSNFPIPFTLLNTHPTTFIKNRSIFRCYRITINTEIKIIGSNTVKKNGASPAFAIPPNTKETPSFAYSSRTLKTLATPLMMMRPYSVFSKNKDNKT